MLKGLFLGMFIVIFLNTIISIISSSIMRQKKLRDQDEEIKRLRSLYKITQMSSNHHFENEIDVRRYNEYLIDKYNLQNESFSSWKKENSNV